jgi:D-sedoheptulose 7-phosphate isomerase
MTTFMFRYACQDIKKETSMDRFSVKYIADFKDLLDRFPHDQFDRLVDAMLDCCHNGGQIFVMGNGGSASTASHWVCDINKGCSFGRDLKFKMICLNDSISTMLAYANDLSYEDVFVEQLKNFFVPGDLVIGISGSGNSKNVLKAIAFANQNGGVTAGLTGYSGGKLIDLVDIPILAAIDDMQKVEDLHVIVVHMAMQKIQNLSAAECQNSL